jgi:small subunit ribosomal protein S20
VPVTTSAKKALRVSRRKAQFNKPVRSKMTTAVKQVRQKPNQKQLKKAYEALDKAAKKNIIHKKKADRLKSRLALLVNRTSSKK